MRTLRGFLLEWTARTAEVPLRELIAVPVDAGKSSAMVMACDFTGRVLLPALEFALTREGVGQMLERVSGGGARQGGWSGSGWRRLATTTGRSPCRGCGLGDGSSWSSTRRT
jgi:hypothetical protein